MFDIMATESGEARMERFESVDTAESPMEHRMTLSRSDTEASLALAARAFAERHGLAFKTVPMQGGPEPRIGLGFYPSGRLRDVVVRLAWRPHVGVRAISQLSVVEASLWGDVRPMLIYRMRSETTFKGPLETMDLDAFLERAVEQARRSKR